MSTTDTFLAIFLGSKTSPRMAAWNSLPEGVRRATMQEESRLGKPGPKSIMPKPTRVFARQRQR